MKSINNLADIVSIGIATKNRWQDIQITLNKISEAGLNSIPIVIFDDNSDFPCPFNLNILPLNIHLQRFSESKGYIVRRNQLAQTIQTKYYLSLDDDSFPVVGSLQAAVEFAESHPDIFCLSFPVYNPIVEKYQSRSLKSVPYQVRSFIGCGHLLNVYHFLQIGGYCEELIHQGEEMDIAARAFQKGLYCYHFPDFEIHHIASNQGRNWHRMDFYGSRNIVFWNDWFVPIQLKWLKQSRTLISRLILTMKVRRSGSLHGEWAALKSLHQYRAYRHPMSLELFRRWQELPFT